MYLRRILCVAVMLALSAAVPAGADVRVTVRDGRVDIAATDATVGEILAEWARVTGMTIVHAEVLPPERVTIDLRDATESDALAVLLRGAGGYVASARAGTDPATSMFDV